ncbi:MAG: HtaA domain-containing protein [Corynebacterium sp.]|nr:HtaA domain-containing protein [Corynebacterium sp.]
MKTRDVVAGTPAATEVAVPTKPATAVNITTGSVDWGFRASWRNYSKDMELFYTGLTINTDGTYHMPVKDGWYDAASQTTVLNFDAGLRWLGHYEGDDYLLDVMLNNLSLVISPDGIYIAGDYTGISMDDMQGPRVKYTGIHIADADFSSATINQDFDANGTATATNIKLPTLWGGKNMPIYTYPSAMDSLSLSYDGPGTLPKVEDKTVSGDQPAFTSGGSINQAGTSQYFTSKSGNGNIIYAVNGNKITAINGDTMQEITSATVEGYDGGSYQWGFYSEPSVDPSSQQDHIYVLAFGTEGSREYDVAFTTSTKEFDEEEYTKSDYDLLAGGLGVTSKDNPRLYWVEGTTYGLLFSSKGIFKLSDLGTDSEEAFTLISDGDVGKGSNAGLNNNIRIIQDPANPDSRYLIANTDTTARGAGNFAAIHLSTNKAEKTSLATVDTFKAVDGEKLAGYTHILDLSGTPGGNPGEFFAFGSPGVYAFMNVNNGVIHREGEAQRLAKWDIGGTYGAAASPDGKYVYLLNREKATIYVIDRATHEVTETIAAPNAGGANAVAGSLQEFRVDESGNLYYSTYSGLAKLSYQGIRAGFDTPGTNINLEYKNGASTTATITVATHGAADTDTITWQKRNSGTLSWKEIEGASGTTLNLDVANTDPNQDIRAVLHTSLGDIRSDIFHVVQPEGNNAPDLDEDGQPTVPEAKLDDQAPSPKPEENTGKGGETSTPSEEQKPATNEGETQDSENEGGTDPLPNQDKSILATVRDFLLGILRSSWFVPLLLVLNLGGLGVVSARQDGLIP